ncbi:MAG: ATP-binding protein, partial [Candidatus Eisenbacteria bacterium]|nr:ATP-binding protein [Candidatus Eisenbacteria bacterium]
AFLSLVERALRGEPAGGTAIEMEMEMETATGTVTEAATATGAGTATGTRSRLRVRGDALRGDDGTPSGAVLVLADVTEIRRLERIRRDFVANVSHELKTPITAIRGYAETLLEDVEDADSETRRRFLGILEKQASRMNRIIEDLLALSRLESTGGTIERSCFDPRALAERAVRDAEGEAARRGVRIDLQTPAKPGPLAPLWANEALLERALGNLIDNALKYGARDGTVRVAVEEDVDGAGGGGVRFSVADEGPGIPAEHLHRLFERFYRVDKGRSRELGGTGLGLAIVRHIALVHGGEAGVESEEGRGSVFHLRIPRRRPPDSAHARREPGGAR